MRNSIILLVVMAAMVLGLAGCGGGKVSDCLTSIAVDDVMVAAQEFLGA